MGADGEEQDAYILGVDYPIEEFTGKITAMVHRINDVEDKWVVDSEDKAFTAKQIEEQIYFQEQYFEYEIIMWKMLEEQYYEKRYVSSMWRWHD